MLARRRPVHRLRAGIGATARSCGSGSPAGAVVVALREVARKLGSVRLGDATIFATLEPCAMCVGALLESNVEALVFAVPNRTDGAAGSILQLAQHPDLPRRMKVVSGIRRDEAEELFAAAPANGAR